MQSRGPCAPIPAHYPSPPHIRDGGLPPSLRSVNEGKDKLLNLQVWYAKLIPNPNADNKYRCGAWQGGVGRRRMGGALAIVPLQPSPCLRHGTEVRQPH